MSYTIYNNLQFIYTRMSRFIKTETCFNVHVVFVGCSKNFLPIICLFNIAKTS